MSEEVTTVELNSMSDRELKQRLMRLYESIFLFDCFGVRDLLEFEAVRRELERRGYEVVKSVKIRRRR